MKTQLDWVQNEGIVRPRCCTKWKITNARFLAWEPETCRTCIYRHKLSSDSGLKTGSGPALCVDTSSMIFFECRHSSMIPDHGLWKLVDCRLKMDLLDRGFSEFLLSNKGPPSVPCNGPCYVLFRTRSTTSCYSFRVCFHFCSKHQISPQQAHPSDEMIRVGNNAVYRVLIELQTLEAWSGLNSNLPFGNNLFHVAAPGWVSFFGGNIAPRPWSLFL